MSNLEYVLKQLEANAPDKSRYADAILDFWNMDNRSRFFVHACVFKGMRKELEQHIKAWNTHKMEGGHNY